VHSQNGASPEDDPEGNVVWFHYIRTGSGGKPILPIAFSTHARSVDVPSVLVPAAPVTRLSPMWSESIDLSAGQVVAAQLRDRTGGLVGPPVELVPQIDPELGSDVDEEWHARAGAALGQDFLQHVTVGLLGPAQVIAVDFGDLGGFAFNLSAN
jgi:hypothetical protein